MGRELLRGPPVPVQGGRQVLELDRLTPRRTTDQQRDKGGDDETGHPAAVRGVEYDVFGL